MKEASLLSRSPSQRSREETRFLEVLKNEKKLRIMTQKIHNFFYEAVATDPARLSARHGRTMYNSDKYLDQVENALEDLESIVSKFGST